MLGMMLLVALLVTLGGCQSAGDGAGDVETIDLRVTWWGNEVRNEKTQAALALYSEAHPEVLIDGQFSEWTDYWHELSIAAAGRSLPDVLQMDYAYLNQYTEHNLLLDLTPYVAEGSLNLSAAQETVVASGQVDGKLYAVATGINAPALVYNKTVTDAAGVTVKDNMTLDEFVDLARTIYVNTGYKTNYACGVGHNILSTYLRGNGRILYEDGRLGVDDPTEFEPFFAVYEQGHLEGWHIGAEVFAKIPAGSVPQDPLVAGTQPENSSWSVLCWSNQYMAYAAAAPAGVELKLTTQPTENPGRSNFLKPSQFFAVAANSPNQETAVDLIDYWTNSVAANEILLGERGVPLSQTVSAAITSQLSPADQEVLTFVNEVIAPNSSPLNPPDPSGSFEVAALINTLVEQVAGGQLTATDAAETLYREGNEIMARNNNKN